MLLAGKQLEVAEQAAKTAQSILDRSQARFDSGLVVESDLLTAKVRMATRQQELIRATQQSGSGAGPVEYRDGRADGLLVPAGGSLGGTCASGPCS